MFQRRSALALCVGALVVSGVSACSAADTGGAAAGTSVTPTGTTSSTVASSAPATTSAAVPTEYGVPTTAAPGPDPTDVATDAPVTPAASGDEVSVLITFADWNSSTAAVEVFGYANVVESGGTCTAELTQGGRTVSATSAGEPDAATTSCGALSVPGAQLAPGTWEAVLSYASGTASGASGPVEVVVP